MNGKTHALYSLTTDYSIEKINENGIENVEEIQFQLTVREGRYGDWGEVLTEELITVKP